MQTSRAIVAAAVIIAGTGAATAYMLQPRYSLANPGQGVTVRLDRKTGDMMGCEGLTCRPVVEGGKAISYPWEEYRHPKE